MVEPPNIPIEKLILILTFTIFKNKIQNNIIMKKIIIIFYLRFSFYIYL